MSVLTAMDQIGEAQNQLKQLVPSVLPYHLLPLKEGDTLNLDFFFKELLGSLDRNHQGPLFPPVELHQPALDPIHEGLPEETRTMILKAVQDSHQVNLDRTGFWQSTMEASFKT